MSFAPCIQLASEGSECRSAVYLGAADGWQAGYYTRSHRNRAHTLIRLDHDGCVLKHFSI